MTFIARLLSRIQRNSACLHTVRAATAILRLPISIKKVVINSCQTGIVHDSDFGHLYLPPIIDPFNKSLLSKKDFLESLTIALHDLSSRSLLWMITRTCPENPACDESEAVRAAGFIAEIGATQTIFSNDQSISYSSFFRNIAGANDPGQWWVKQSHDIRDSFIASIRGKVLYPAVNRQKNVSQDTMVSANLVTGSYDYFRSLDLELEYARTGIQHGGECEVRSAWKFNNLKPRLYYCTGGRQYWASRYMKVIAVKLMESIPSTHVKLRTSPTDFLASDFNTDYVTAWDYSAFTSTLSELKHFVWYVARMCEKAGTTVTLFDYRYGYVYDVPIFELLDEYNEVANMHAKFSVHRMVGQFLEENPELYRSMNSGLLGVHGNIGFSTALHGLVICKECGAKRCVCVGDDGLGITSEDPSISLIPAISRLGVLHPEKFGRLGPADDVRHIRFLKRKLMRVGDGFTLSVLLNFPITAYIDGIVGSRDMPLKFSYIERLYKFSTHTAELLWDLERYYDQLTEFDIELALSFLEVGYQFMRIPRGGLFPGSTIHGEDPGEKHELTFTIPRIEDYHPKHGDWIEFMIRFSPTLFFKAPVYMARYTVTHVVKGYHMLPESPLLSCLEDLGFLETEKLYEWILVLGVGSARVLSRMLRREEDGMVKAMAVRVFSEVPERFFMRSFPEVDQTWYMEDMECL